MAGSRQRRDRQAKKRIAVRTSKIVDRLTYSPNKHKQKERRKMREKLKARSCQGEKNADLDLLKRHELTFASMNVDKMGFECEQAICQILVDRNYDVSIPDQFWSTKFARGYNVLNISPNCRINA